MMLAVGRGPKYVDLAIARRGMQETAERVVWLNYYRELFHRR
jgi:hypothetical protein